MRYDFLVHAETGAACDYKYHELDCHETWEVMQWTGLHDKNGADVYEGDLLRLLPKNDWERTHFASFEVFWHDNDCSPTDVGLCLGRAMFHGNLAGGYCGYKLVPRDVGRMVVIGNIYENPELTTHGRNGE